jgi:hypothetical protein
LEKIVTHRNKKRGLPEPTDDQKRELLSRRKIMKSKGPRLSRKEALKVIGAGVSLPFIFGGLKSGLAA